MSAVSLATCYRGVCLQPQTRSWNQGPSDTTTRQSALNAAPTHTRTHTRICYQTEHYRWCIWVTELYFFPRTENSWVSCFDYSHENSKKQNPDADLQRQLSQVLPAVGGCRVHGSEINPTKETQQSESAQGLFHSAVIQLNKEGAWTHRCSLITHGARLHRTSVTWRSVSRCPRGSPLISTSWCFFFCSSFSSSWLMTAFLLITSSSLALLQPWLRWFRVFWEQKNKKQRTNGFSQPKWR